jgi:hypothetical protein
MEFSSIYSAVIYFSAVLFFIAENNYLKIRYKSEILFTLFFIFFGCLSLLVKNSTDFFNIVGPCFGLFGYIYVRRKVRMDLNIFKYIIILFYFFSYFVYYSVLPDYFFRPGFDEDAIVFDNSSSNAITMALNIILFIYLVLNKYYKSNHIKYIFYFSIINLILIFIQQSRIGLVVSVFLLFISFYEYSEISIKKLFSFISFILILAFIYFFKEISDLYYLFFSDYSYEKVFEGVRSKSQVFFFTNLNLESFLFGYSDNTVFASHINDDLIYTYNVFLDVWNRYGFFPFITLVFVLIYRFFRHKKYFFPLHYLIPFIAYSFVESIFFPNFWDFFIYLLIFTPIQHQNINAN